MESSASTSTHSPSTKGTGNAGRYTAIGLIFGMTTMTEDRLILKVSRLGLRK